MAITEVNAHLKYVNSSGDTTVIYPITKMDNVEGLKTALTNTEKSIVSIKEEVDETASSVVPVSRGGTGRTTAADARANLGVAPAYTYGTRGYTAGNKSNAPDGTIHFVYNKVDGVWDRVKSIYITVDGVWRLVWDMASSSGSGDSSDSSYSISTNLTGVTRASSNATTISKNGTVELMFTANTRYTLPETVSVVGAEYIWDNAVGSLILSNPTGNVTVTITGVLKTYPITTNLTGVTADSSNLSFMVKDDVISLSFVAKSGYTLPSTVGVVGAEYTWNSSSGILILSNPTGNVTVTINGVAQAVGGATYTTTIKINGQTVYEKSDTDASPDVKISVHSGTSYSDMGQYAYVDEGLQYREDTDSYQAVHVRIFTYAGATKNFLGFSETSGSTVASYGTGGSVISGTNGADTVVNLYPVAEDATMYDTVISIDSETVKKFSYKNFSPDIGFTVTKTGAEFTCELTGDTYNFVYDGTNTFTALVYDELDYNVNSTGTVHGWDASDTTAEFTTFAWSVTEDTVQPLKFYTLDGNEFTVSTQYAGISNVEYSYDNSKWTTGSLGINSTSTLTSQNGVIYLRGINASFGGSQMINSRGVGMHFSEPVMCTGDLVSMLSYEGIVDSLDGRCFFGFFVDSTNLLCPPNLPSKVLNGFCYEALFTGCTSMVVNTQSSDGYSREWRIPTTGTAIAVADTNGDTYPPLYMALDNTAGNYKDIAVSFSGVSVPGTPDINTTYYIKDLS